MKMHGTVPAAPRRAALQTQARASLPVQNAAQLQAGAQLPALPLDRRVLEEFTVVAFNVVIADAQQVQRPAAGPLVRPPVRVVPNCPLCPEPIVPEMCRRAPGPLRFHSVSTQPSFAVTDDSNSNIGRRLLSKKKKKSSSKHQPRFSPPSLKMREQFGRMIASWVAGNETECGFWTRDCVRSPADYFPNKGMPENYLELFPDLQPGAFGTCAIVAVGDNMLHQQRGPEIDSHDTVFRYNSPMARYSDDIGIKSDIVYWKVRNDEVQYGQENQRATKFYMFKSMSKYFENVESSEVQQQKYLGLPLLWPTRLADKLIYPTYVKYMKEAKLDTIQAPPGGFKWFVQVLASGMCSRIDLYGYTAKGSGKYFERDSVMSTVHLAGLDHWVYRLAMELGAVCIYD
eukprot:jgi/Chlat1/3740/Chrsp259S08833